MAGQHHGGSWKVAYADFVTAMMAFFMVMWITGQNAEVKGAIAHYFNHPFAFPSKVSGSTSILPIKGSEGAGGAGRWNDNSDGPGHGRGQGTANTSLEEKGNQRATFRQKAGVFVLHDGKCPVKGTVIQFAESSADLTAEAKDQLGKTALTLLGLPNKIEIRGHSTRRPLPPGSPFHDVWQLTYARCLATMEYLVERGIESERIRLSQAGPFEPQTIRLAPDWEKLNSRVEVYLLDETVEDLTGTREERNERLQAPPGEEADAKKDAEKAPAAEKLGSLQPRLGSRDK
ncbi:MAG: OmpA family protein [Planctomycetia bacterium]|nr:OmpA family protein [Planctomycetia bacterium]